MKRKIIITYNSISRKLPLLLSIGFLVITFYGSASAQNSIQVPPRLMKPGDCGVGRRIPNFSFTTLNGKKLKLSDINHSKALVIAFFSITCPVSKLYLPTIAKIQKRFLSQGITFLMIDPIATDKSASVKALAQIHHITAPIALDPNERIASLLGARTTADTFLIDSAHTVLFHGAVDDQYGLDYSLAAPRHNFLIDAIEAFLHGEKADISATTAPGCTLMFDQHVSTTGQITYYNQISRIIQNNCLECHHSGGIAPFSLANYQDVMAHSGMINTVVSNRVMPPWFAAPTPAGEPDPWANDSSLADRDRKDLLAWLHDGRPAGEASQAPVPKQFSSGWKIGKPDLILTIPKPIAVKATGFMPYKYEWVPTNFESDRWIQAVEVHPTTLSVVHHVLVFILPPGLQGGMSPLAELAGKGPAAGFLAGYVPGNSSEIYSPGFAKRIPKGSTLLFQLHFTPDGVAHTDQTKLGFIFAKSPPRYPLHVVGIANMGIRIPPHAPDWKQTAERMFHQPIEITGFFPHMHLRGKAFKYELITPDGHSRTLLYVPRYDFHWQLYYRLARPVYAPAGSAIKVTAWYDNSANNPSNPDPNRTVPWGPQTYDEMLIGYVEFYNPDRKIDKPVAYLPNISINSTEK